MLQQGHNKKSADRLFKNPELRNLNWHTEKQIPVVVS